MGRHRKKPTNGMARISSSSNGMKGKACAQYIQKSSSDWSRITVPLLLSKLASNYLLVPVLAIIAIPVLVQISPAFLDIITRRYSSVGTDANNGGWRLADVSTLAKYDSTICHVDRRFSHELSEAEFNRVYRNKKPVIVRFTQGAFGWTDSTKWSVASLKNAYGRWRVKSGNSRDIVRQGGSGNVLSSFSQFVDDMLSSVGTDVLGEPLYLFDRGFYNSTGLPETIKPPRYFTIRDGIDDSIFFLGASGSGVSFHQHAEAWNGVVYGKKRWFLYHRDITPPGGVYPGFTQLEWFTSVYPHLPSQDLPLECVQQSGEILYLPEGLYHGTVNIGDTIAVGIQKKLATTEFGQLYYEFGVLEKQITQPGVKGKMVEIMEKLLAWAPDNTEMMMKLGISFRNLDDYQTALHHLQRAVDTDPLFVVAWLDLAKVYEGLGELAQAEDCYVRAGATNSSLWDIFAFYGDFLLRQKRPGEAINVYNKGIALKPDMVMFWTMLKQAQDEIGDHEGMSVSQSHIDALNEKL